MRLFFGLSIIGTIALASSIAGADETVSLDYGAPQGCPNDDAFWSAFVSRASHAHRSSGGEWSMLVRTIDEGSSFRARIEVKHGDAITQREVTDPSCTTATTALAVIAALTVEPEPVKIVHTEPDLPPPKPPPPAPSPWHLRFGGAFVTTTVLSPTVSLGALGYADVTRDVSRFFALRMRAGFHWATSLDIDVASASALVTTYLARIEIGGPRAPLTQSFEANLAALFDAGDIVGEGRGVSAGHSEPSTWLDVGAIAHLRLSVWRLGLEAGFGAIVPLTRPRFVFQPGPVVVYEPPVFGALAELDVSLQAF